MIDASALFMFAVIGSVFMWVALLFKIVMSPFAETTKWKLVGVLVVIALCYIFVPTWIVNACKLKGYGAPAAIASALFLVQVILYFMINVSITRYEKLKE